MDTSPLQSDSKDLLLLCGLAFYSLLVVFRGTKVLYNLKIFAYPPGHKDRLLCLLLEALLFYCSHLNQ